MRVKMLATIAGPYGSATPGETIDLPTKAAKELVAGGYAVPALAAKSGAKDDSDEPDGGDDSKQ
jgi:hypothetical protein